jgi:hypothetical protein
MYKRYTRRQSVMVAWEFRLGPLFVERYRAIESVGTPGSLCIGWHYSMDDGTGFMLSVNKHYIVISDGWGQRRIEVSLPF